jgi:hypothetical protein
MTCKRALSDGIGQRHRCRGDDVPLHTGRLVRQLSPYPLRLAKRVLSADRTAWRVHTSARLPGNAEAPIFRKNAGISVG